VGSRRRKGYGTRSVGRQIAGLVGPAKLRRFWAHVSVAKTGFGIRVDHENFYWHAAKRASRERTGDSYGE